MLRTDLIRPIADLLDLQARQRPDKVAFVDPAREVTYLQLARRTGNLAGHLALAGLRPGQRGLIYMANAAETAEAYLALPRAGAVAVCVNPASAPAEVAYVLDDSDARVIVTDPEHAPVARQLIGGRDDITLLVTGAQPGPLAAGEASYERLATTDPGVAANDGLALDDVAWMLYTSGTTGRPKGVLLTQRSCLWVVAACWAPIAGLSDRDLLLSPLPLFHSYALDLCVLGGVATGATVRIMPRFSTGEVIRLLRNEPVTFFAGVPTMYQYLLTGADSDGLAGNRLRLCVSAGAIMPGSVNQEFEDRFGVTLLDGYGITETSTMVTMNWPTGARVMGSCGLPVPGLTVRLVDPATGRDVAPGDDGELWVSGPGVMLGYHNLPEATATALVDGWYRTGDLAHRDANGYLTISGRIKEMIIRGGENIYPAEVENVLVQLPGIADAAVVARPHDSLGEVPVGFVVFAEPDVDVSAVLAACREQVAAYKVPVELYLVDEIPRTGSGKIMRYKLQERFDEIDPLPVGQ